MKSTLHRTKINVDAAAKKGIDNYSCSYQRLQRSCYYVYGETSTTYGAGNWIAAQAIIHEYELVEKLGTYDFIIELDNQGVIRRCFNISHADITHKPYGENYTPNEDEFSPNTNCLYEQERKFFIDKLAK